MLTATFAAAALAGCSQGPNLSAERSEGDARVQTASLEKAEKPEARVVKTAAAAQAERYQSVEIRTEIRRAGVEIVGADCSAVSTEVSLSFKTPAKLSLPLLGAQTPPLTVRCEHPLQGGVAVAMIQPGAEVKSGALLEEVFGGDKPSAGAYLPSYTLQLAKEKAPTVSEALKTAEAVRSSGEAPPPALAAALETAAKATTQVAFDTRILEARIPDAGGAEAPIAAGGVSLPLRSAPAPRPAPRLGGFDLMPIAAAR